MSRANTPPVQPEAAKKETREQKMASKDTWVSTRRRRRRRMMRGEDERKDEIKTRAAVRKEEKGPKQGQGEGGWRYYTLVLKFREEKKFTAVSSLQRLTVQSQPPLTRLFTRSRNVRRQAWGRLREDRKKTKKQEEVGFFKSHAQEQEREEDLWGHKVMFKH